MASTAAAAGARVVERGSSSPLGASVQPDGVNFSVFSNQFTWRTLHARFLLHGMLNAYWEPLTFELPPVPDHSRQRWRRCIDTARASPHDVYRWEEAPTVAASAYVVEPRSIVLLALALPKIEGSHEN